MNDRENGGFSALGPHQADGTDSAYQNSVVKFCSADRPAATVAAKRATAGAKRAGPCRPPVVLVALEDIII